ncbi:MAG: thermonuclease family protein [Pseudomonadota bacterium]
MVVATESGEQRINTTISNNKMKRPSQIIKLSIGFALTIILSFILPSLALAGNFKVTRVYDGDTVRAVGHGVEIQVRLVGIDAPEISHKKRDPGQPYGQQATKHLAGLVLNKVVDIRGYGLDQYRGCGFYLTQRQSQSITPLAYSLFEPAY